MNPTSRRQFFKCTATGGMAIASLSNGRHRLFAANRKPSDIRVEQVSVSFEELAFRSPFQFAGTTVYHQTMSTVQCTVRTVDGRVTNGFGILPLNYTFTFPSKKLAPDVRLAAMKALAEELAKVTASYQEFGHPLEINYDLVPRYDKAAADVSKRLQLADPIPKLCTLVTAGAFDAALYDAYGKAHGLNSFHMLGPEFMNHDLSRYLGSEYRGEYPSQYVMKEPKPRMPVSHTISGADPITAADNAKPLNDGLPETIAEWIEHSGLTYFKIKLNGTDLDWDVERMRSLDRVVSEVQKKRGVKNWAYVPDFNEKCLNVDYYIAFLRRIQESMPEGFRRIEYVEQPTNRDLRSHPENAMHKAAELCPVVIDESVIDVDSVHLAKTQGWTGVVVKSPKGLSHMLLIVAVASKNKLLVAGGDMSCPGAALIQTVSFQARLPGVTNIEANARQFFPAANKPLEARFPGMFNITDGLMGSRELVQPGLGA